MPSTFAVPEYLIGIVIIGLIYYLYYVSTRCLMNYVLFVLCMYALSHELFIICIMYLRAVS